MTLPPLQVQNLGAPCRWVGDYGCTTLCLSCPHGALATPSPFAGEPEGFLAFGTIDVVHIQRKSCDLKKWCYLVYPYMFPTHWNFGNRDPNYQALRPKQARARRWPPRYAGLVKQGRAVRVPQRTARAHRAHRALRQTRHLPVKCTPFSDRYRRSKSTGLQSHRARAPRAPRARHPPWDF